MPRGKDLGRAESIHGERVSRFARGMHTTPKATVYTTHRPRQEPCPWLAQHGSIVVGEERSDAQET